MATDGDRHQLGDPISRLVNDDSQNGNVVTDDTDPAQLTDEELRRQLANLDQIVQEAPSRGTPPDITEQAQTRLRLLNIEHRRRTTTSG